MTASASAPTLTVLSPRTLSQTTLDYIARLARRYGCAVDDVLYYRDGFPMNGFQLRVNDPGAPAPLESIQSFTNAHEVALPA